MKSCVLCRLGLEEAEEPPAFPNARFYCDSSDTYNQSINIYQGIKRFSRPTAA